MATTAKKTTEPARPAKKSQAELEYDMLTEALAVATEQARSWARLPEAAPEPTSNAEAQ